MKTFTESELRSIYETKVRKTKDYFGKNNPIPPCPVKKWDNNWNGHDAPRAFAILDFIDWVEKYNINNIDHLAITCDSDAELEFITYENSSPIGYPTYDLHIDYIELHNKFDFFMFNQTIEHLYNPFMAVENIHKYIKPGGYVYTTVPTINIPHMTPAHFNGYNPMGLALLFASAGFEVLEIGQWGNYEYISKLFKDHHWPDLTQVTNANEEKNVAQCWILAKK